MLSDVMLSVAVRPSVIMLNVVRLNVVAPFICGKVFLSAVIRFPPGKRDWKSLSIPPLSLFLQHLFLPFSPKSSLLAGTIS